MARQARRLWTDEEKRSICFQTAAANVSVAQVARRYAMNANMVFKWLRDSRYAPAAGPVVEIVDRPRSKDPPPTPDPVATPGTIEVDIAGGHRLRIVGGYDPERLARLIRGLSG